MLTRRGWVMLAGAACLVVAGRLLGIVELFALAAASVALVIGATAYVRSRQFRLEATRTLHPRRVHAGGSCRVDLVVRNPGTRRTPLIALRDPFDGGRRWARFLLPPVAPGTTAQAAYRLPTDRRGVFDLGPLTVEHHDPFGVARTERQAAPATRLTVFPHVVAIDPLPHTLGQDPHAGADHPTALGRSGEDFYALRPYETGDDLRRVHWPSTARTGDLMIRQDEMPWQGRAMVLLDLRAAVHDERSLELAVSAAASIVTSCWQHRSLVRLVATDGTDSGFAAGHTHVDAILERLATARAEPGGSLRALAGTLRRESGGGALAAVTGSGATAADLAAVGRLRGRVGLVSIVVAGGTGRVRARASAVPGVGAVIRAGNLSEFADGWKRTAAVPTRRMAKR